MPGKRKGKQHQRTIDKIHILVRLELANPQLNATEVARLCGLGITSYSILKNSLLYRTIHNQYLSGVLSTLDTQVKDTLNMTQETLKFAVPVAMQALLKQALQEKDQRIQNKAANDILDRDGHFAKVTRIGLPTGDQGGVADKKDNDIAADLINALASQPPANNKQRTPPPTINDPSITETTQ